MSLDKKPEESGNPQEEAKLKIVKLLAQFGFSIGDISGLLQDTINQSIVKTLDAMNIGQKITDSANAVVDAKLQALLKQLPAAGGAAAAKGAAEAPPPLGDQLIGLFLQRMVGGQGSGGGLGEIDKMADMLQSLQKIGDALNAPYNRGRHDTLVEVNENLKFMRSLGAGTEAASKAIEQSNARELGKAGAGDAAAE